METKKVSVACPHCQHKHQSFIHPNTIPDPVSYYTSKEEIEPTVESIYYITNCPNCNNDYYHLHNKILPRTWYDEWRNRILKTATELGVEVDFQAEIHPGDVYLAAYNTGPHLLTCDYVHKDGWIKPVEWPDAACFNTNHCALCK